jgi:hypothetical protein
MDPNAITIVSGLPRSGTSMMMKMLEGGGMPILTDHVRRADADNPKGYYEFEPVKHTKEDPSWLEQAQGKAVKMVSMLLYDLPKGYDYHVIFMRRDLTEILASQKAMLIRSGKDPAQGPSDEAMRAHFEEHLVEVSKWIEAQPRIQVLEISYNAVLGDTAAQVAALRRFVGEALDADAMKQVVTPALYRQRTTP